MKFTSSLQYRLLRAILNHNTNFHFPKLNEIAKELDFTTLNAIKVCLSECKKKELLKTIGSRRNYSYYLSELGIDRVRNFEDYDDRQILIALYQLRVCGD
jgi:hypothetical protein